VLLLKHTFRRRYPWGLLSGWVKRRESLEAALRREAAEETSLPITVDRLYRIRTDRLHLAIEAVFLCRCDEGTFRPSGEVTDARWCHADDLPPGLHPHHHPLIHEALRDRARLPAA
jgi:8-oxo-dGTP pyrophosphatase MutT (NUDIX family)